MDGLDGAADAAGGGACSAHDAPGFELGEGAFAGGSESGVVAVELLVVLGLFAVVVVGSANGGARIGRTATGRCPG